MASQVSPGIVLKERDLSNVVVTGTLQITAAIASSFAKGPVGEIVNINSQKELVNIFGAPVDANADDWHVASEFLGYGGRLAVVRATTSTLLNAGSTQGVLVKSDADWEAGAGGSEAFVARTAGTWGNSATVVVVDRGADQYVTFDKALDSAVLGSTVTFASGKTGKILSASSNELAIVLDDPLNKIAAGDSISEEDPIASFTHNAVTEAGRTHGTYTPAADAGGASFQVVVAQGAEILDVTDPQNPVSFDPPQYEGGAVTVTLLTPGDNYSVGDTIVLTGASTGGGSDITATVSAIVDPEAGVTSVKDWYLNTQIGSTGISLAAIGPRPGTSQFAADRGISYDEVHVAVIDTTGEISGTANTILERLTYLSKLSDATGAQGEKTYYKDVINEQSAQIYNGAHPTAVVTGLVWGQPSTGLSGALGLVGLHTDALIGGVDNYAYSDAEISDAYDLFADTEASEIDFILMGGPMADESDTKIKANKVTAIATTRKDCVAFVSPHKGNQIGTGGALTSAQQRDNTIAFFSTLTSTSYAMLDSGYKYFYDRFTDKYRWLACNGDVAGLCVATSAALDDWYSPAGVNRGSLRNAVKLAYNPNKADRDELYQNRINPIVSFPGQGITLFGDKTALASPSAFDRINVRRLFLNVEKRAGELAKQVLFEQNDETTRASFSSAMNSYLNEVQSRRGITDFLVVCDSSNNTADVIDRNEFVAEIYIKPTRSINFITITFTATKTGVSFSEVVGR